MRTITFICLLIASAQMITIKISKKDGKIYKPPAMSSNDFIPHNKCAQIVVGVEMANLFNIYSRQIFNILSDKINELMLVKHEHQSSSEGVMYRSIFRVKDTENYDKLYYGFKFFVDLESRIRVIGYLESFDVKEIFTAFDWDSTGNKGDLYSYPCNNIQDNAIMAFNNWGKELNVCTDHNNNGTQQNSINAQILQNEQVAAMNEAKRVENEAKRLENLNKAAMNEAKRIQNLNEATRLEALKNKYAMEEAVRQEAIRKAAAAAAAAASTSAPANTAAPTSDSPFHTINLKVHTQDSNGNPIIIGSAAPKKASRTKFSFPALKPFKPIASPTRRISTFTPTTTTRRFSLRPTFGRIKY